MPYMEGFMETKEDSVNYDVKRALIACVPVE